MDSSKERENFVYVAKLAEQAERYDGQFLYISLDILHASLCFISLDLCFHAQFLLIIDSKSHDRSQIYGLY